MSIKTPRSAGFAARTLIALVQLYRWTIAFVIGGHCRFYPSCSRYAQDALRRYGAWRGSLLAAHRLGRCHPWYAGGVDEVPDMLPRLWTRMRTKR